MNPVNGSPAFPQYSFGNHGVYVDGGMTLRDYFAAKVLITACEDFSPAEAARLAYDYADAMLEVRK